MPCRDTSSSRCSPITPAGDDDERAAGGGARHRPSRARDLGPRRRDRSHAHQPRRRRHVRRRRGPAGARARAAADGVARRRRARRRAPVVSAARRAPVGRRSRAADRRGRSRQPRLRRRRRSAARRGPRAVVPAAVRERRRGPARARWVVALLHEGVTWWPTGDSGTPIDTRSDQLDAIARPWARHVDVILAGHNFGAWTGRLAGTPAGEPHLFASSLVVVDLSDAAHVRGVHRVPAVRAARSSRAIAALEEPAARVVGELPEQWLTRTAPNATCRTSWQTRSVPPPAP